jgi:hypothetical protein
MKNRRLKVHPLTQDSFEGESGYDPYHRYHSGDSDDSCGEIECVHIQLENVTTVRLDDMSMEEIERIEPILIHSFPNLQCLILRHTEFVLKENKLALFLGQKLQRIEFDESFLDGSGAQGKDFSYLFNLKHLNITYGSADADVRPDIRAAKVRHLLLTKLSTLETLSIYATSISLGWYYSTRQILEPILSGLNQDEIKTKYEIKYFGEYICFIRNVFSSSSLSHGNT